jgi:hypothetical protein
MQPLHLKMRQAAMIPPRATPYRLMARCPYTEQVGLCRQRPRGRFGFVCHASIIRSTVAFIGRGCATVPVRS